MIYITQLIYIRDGQESIFDQFEAIAIPSIPRYNGRLLLRVRPPAECYVESSIERPYEIHLVEFETEVDFQNYMRDEERAVLAFEGAVDKIGFTNKGGEIITTMV